MIKTTTWELDTCRCVVEYTWDDAAPDADRVHTFRRFTRVCSEHAGMNRDAEHYERVLAENQGRNLAFAALIKQVPDTARKVVDPVVLESLSAVLGLAPEVVAEKLALPATVPGQEVDASKVSWRFEGADRARVLKLRVSGFDAASVQGDRRADKAALDVEFARLGQAVVIDVD